MFSEKIISWYLLNKRDLPWRRTKNSYNVWLSEIILQQTRVTQGLPYYKKFIKTFPNLQDLAKASEQEVLKLWQGLGYYSRARNMLATAQYVDTILNGKFPTTYTELLKLKGVGDYTASAIASFCHGEITPVLDGNVYRVLSRYFGIKTPIDTSKAKKEFKSLALELIDTNNPGLFNQAIMEFGSLQCTPKKPDCQKCPLHDSCVALQMEEVAVLPKKLKKLKIRKRFFNYLVLDINTAKTLVKQRKDKGIWKNLYEFPLVETENEIGVNLLISNIDFINFIEKQDFSLKEFTPNQIVHKLSHQHLHIKFWILKLESFNKELITWKKVVKHPFPIVLHNFIVDFLKQKNQ